MSPITNFGVLALASAALAVPFAHENHRHLHARQSVGDAPVPSGSPVGDSPVGASPFSGKRGVIYNDAAAALPLLASNLMGWGANWISNPAGLSNQVSYIPTLHSADPAFTGSWASDAQNAINNGAKYIFTFNEPDMSSQANMTPEDAARAWKQYVEPLAGKGATLVAPSISNSNNPGEGLEWLQAFIGYCSDCSIGAVNLHWYDSAKNDISLFHQQITAGHTATGLPVFVGEMGFVGSDSDISEALEQTMGWLDQNPAVLGYAYFMAATGYLVDNGVPSPYGLTYMNS